MLAALSRTARIIAVTLAASGLTGPRTGAMQIQGYSEILHERWLPGTYPNDPRLNPGFFAAEYDFSGIGWQTSDGLPVGTLISDRHFIASKHFAPAPSPGGTITFRARDGRIFRFNFSGYDYPDGTDLAIGTLEAPIPADAQIAIYPILVLEKNTAYVGLPAICSGQKGRVGLNHIDATNNLSTPTSPWTFSTYVSTARGESQSESNDSGNPLFVPMNGRLYVIGHLTSAGSAAGTQFTRYSGLPGSLVNLRAVMARVNRAPIEYTP